MDVDADRTYAAPRVHNSNTRALIINQKISRRQIPAIEESAKGDRQPPTTSKQDQSKFIIQFTMDQFQRPISRLNSCEQPSDLAATNWPAQIGHGRTALSAGSAANFVVNEDETETAS